MMVVMLNLCFRVVMILVIVVDMIGLSLEVGLL